MDDVEDGVEGDEEGMEMEETAEEKRYMKKNSKRTQQKVYLPGTSRPLKAGEELQCDESAYRFLHAFKLGYPCLSFDPIIDDQGGSRDSWPVSVSMVAGSQAEDTRRNAIVVAKLSNLRERKQGEEEESSSSDSEDDDKDLGTSKLPVMQSVKIPHNGGINRIRAANIQSATVCAVWNEGAKVQIWNLQQSLQTIAEMDSRSRSETLKTERPLFSFNGHHAEGYAMDWSAISPGKFASGDNKGRIHLWAVGEAGTWSVDQRPFQQHKGSIEDIQWSPTEDNVFASCSSDHSIRLWDARVSPAQACVCTVSKAHESDVNVISWNLKEPLIVSGGDDGVLKVWDLKMIQHQQPVALFKHHKGPITSVHWYPHDSTVFAASGEDNQVSIWDLALEVDEESEETKNEKLDIPPQLLFIHLGQNELKEVRWHPQAVGVLATTALDGFNIFRTINVDA